MYTFTNSAGQQLKYVVLIILTKNRRTVLDWFLLLRRKPQGMEHP
jgi:hypothetical protein